MLFATNEFVDPSLQGYAIVVCELLQLTSKLQFTGPKGRKQLQLRQGMESNSLHPKPFSSFRYSFVGPGVGSGRMDQGLSIPLKASLGLGISQWSVVFGFLPIDRQALRSNSHRITPHNVSPEAMIVAASSDEVPCIGV